MSRKTERALKTVALRRAVGFPVEIAGPVCPLHAVVTGSAGIRAHRASVHEREEVGELVALRVVDRIAGHHRQRHIAASERSRFEAVDRTHHGRDCVRVQRLLRTLHRDELAKTRILTVAIDPLETARGLDVGDVQVRQVRDARNHVAYRRWIV